MPKNQISMAKKQEAIDSFIDLNKMDVGNYSAPVALDDVSDTLLRLAYEFTTTAVENLEKSGRVATGALSDSIYPDKQVMVFGKVYSININAASYFDFVNKGVKGWADKYGGNSPYQFKKGVRGQGNKNSPMVAAIKQWLLKEGLKGVGKENKHPKASKRDNQRAITDSTTRAALRVAGIVRRQGLKPSHFWDNTVTTMTARVQEELGKALKVDIINNLTNGNKK